MKKKAQSHVEFILAAFLFLTLIIFLFTAMFVRIQPEAIKIGEQTACHNARAILTILTAEPGKPTNWDSLAAGPTRIGLTNGTPGIIDFYKWEKMKALQYNVIKSATPINASWYAHYENFVYPNKADTGLCPDAQNTAQLCRQMFSNAQYLYINAQSNKPNTIFRMGIFFPEKEIITVHGGGTPTPPPPVYEANDAVTITSKDNGTLVEIYFHLSTTDTADGFTLDFNGQGLPDMSYIEFLEFRTLGGELPVLIGNLTIEDNFGAGLPTTGVSGPSGVSSAKNYCNVKKRVIMLSAQNPYGLEMFPIDLEVTAW